MRSREISEVGSYFQSGLAFWPTHWVPTHLDHGTPSASILWERGSLCLCEDAEPQEGRTSERSQYLHTGRYLTCSREAELSPPSPPPGPAPVRAPAWAIPSPAPGHSHPKGTEALPTGLHWLVFPQNPGILDTCSALNFFPRLNRTD